jgi:hypothetical protein
MYMTVLQDAVNNVHLQERESVIIKPEKTEEVNL